MKFQPDVLTRKKLEFGFVFFLREDEMSCEFVTAFGDEIFDKVRLSRREEFLHFIGRDLVLAKFLRQFENLPVVLIWLADVVGVVQLDQLAAVHFAFADHFGFGEIDLRPCLALDGLTVLVGFRSTRRKFPTDGPGDVAPFANSLPTLTASH